MECVRCLPPTGLAVAIAISAMSLLSGCAPAPWTSMLLEPAAPAKPVVRPARHVYKKPEPLPVVPMQAEVAPTDWKAVRDLLPKDPTGEPDWVRALAGDMIHPKVSLDAKAAEQPVFDLTLELVPKGMEDFKATFPHGIHTQILACTNCHTGIFQMEKGADPITMEKIFAGEYCGRCHGKVAFAPATGCPRCHLSLPH